MTGKEHLKEVISIHALCEEGDADPRPQCPPDYNFYPRPLRGGRQTTQTLSGTADIISIHALCEEGDAQGSRWKIPRCLFLSTPSARRATPRRSRLHDHQRISIHALCEEGDEFSKLSGSHLAAFLSTPSARRATAGIAPCGHCSEYFYPRPLRGGRRFIVMDGIKHFIISIHALCEEGDVQQVFQLECFLFISIHALCEEGDRKACAEVDRK